MPLTSINNEADASLDNSLVIFPDKGVTIDPTIPTTSVTERTQSSSDSARSASINLTPVEWLCNMYKHDKNANYKLESQEERWNLNDDKMLDLLIQEQNRLRSDIRASEERTSKHISASEQRSTERLSAIEERMDVRLNRIEDLIQKSIQQNDDSIKRIEEKNDVTMQRVESKTEDSVKKLSDKIENSTKHIQGITYSIVGMAIATVISIAALIISIYFGVNGMLKDTKEDIGQAVTQQIQVTNSDAQS